MVKRFMASGPWITRDLKECVLASDYNALTAENAALRKAAPLCEKHQPDGGARATCLVCALIENSAAFSRIDYLCGEPNEMEVSNYDVHCEPELVLKAVAALRAERDALRKDAEQRNKAIQRLMARLADLLQDDDFNTLERWVLEAGFTYPPIDTAMEQSHDK